MIMVVGVIVMLLSVPLLGGRLSTLASVRPRSTWMIGASLGSQVVIISLLPASMPEAVAAAAHVVSYVLAAAFVWRNRAVPGLWLIAVGGGCNLAAIAANGGVMPASPTALRLAGRVPPPDRFVNSGPIRGARLAWLGDVFAIPRRLPLANVFSIGDVLLVVGMGLLVHRVCGTKLSGALSRRHRRRQRQRRQSATTSTDAPDIAPSATTAQRSTPAAPPWPAPRSTNAPSPARPSADAPWPAPLVPGASSARHVTTSEPGRRADSRLGSPL